MKSSITSILNDLRIRFGEEIIAIYGVGSYFDKSLPSDWFKNDMDLIVVMDSLEATPKKEWTPVRFERKTYQGAKVWIGYNTLRGLLNKDLFKRESFANYEWSILDLKYSENSLFLYGDDIRDRLPGRSELNFDYDDVLRRSLYHLDRSYKVEVRDENIEKSKRFFTKAVFKFGFYLCVVLDGSFYSTSIRSITARINEFIHKGAVIEEMGEFLEKSIIYRRTGGVETNFHKLRTRFSEYVFSNLGKGTFHRRMTYTQLKMFLETSFSGLRFLLQLIKKAKKKHTRL